jgi:glucose-1-phosphate cytidylyltransferase
MKVVLFCGGQGLRMREASERLPKPMITVGNRPILLHIMKYFAHFGHREFILCLGHQADVIKEYFLNYKEALLNDFVLSDGGRKLELLKRDMQDWRITFVDTGLQSNIGQRLELVQEYIGQDELFLANYGDVLTDAPLPDMIDTLKRRDKIASFLCVKPTYTFHCVQFDEDATVRRIEDVARAQLWINGGYFVFRREVFDYLREGEELVKEPFGRLIAREELLAYRYEGFWAPMDTLKDRQNLEVLWDNGTRPWAVREHRGRALTLNGNGNGQGARC